MHILWGQCNTCVQINQEQRTEKVKVMMKKELAATQSCQEDSKVHGVYETFCGNLTIIH